MSLCILPTRSDSPHAARLHKTRTLGSGYEGLRFFVFVAVCRLHMFFSDSQCSCHTAAKSRSLRDPKR